ncbi:MAG: efflux RND transporter periplasmic adaptor subunit [Candidatus Gastranaerophilales bacterium]|nr:efflux RND transporter periplasmic adaptor subunit [Candidatus Gastranaerophilales bacterium]
MKKKIIIILIVLVLAAIIFFVIKKQGASSEGYVTAPLRLDTITKIIEASGTINPVQTATVGSQVSGKITAVYVDYNSPVKKGQLLAEIDTSLFQASVDQSKANINNARAQLQKLEATLNYDKLMYERYSNLLQKGYVSKSEVDQLKATYLADLAGVKAQKASIKEAEASYKTAESNLGYTKIYSPVDGVIISKDIEVGETVASSYQTPELFSVAEDLTKMQIETNVSEADIGNVTVGQEADYTIDGYPDETFKGYVNQVRLSSTTTSNVVTYTVVISVNNEDLKLKPGMTANVSIVVQKKENILTAINPALKFTPLGTDVKYDTQGIWILKNNKPERITVETGISDDSKTEIITDELKENDLVIVGKKVKDSSANTGGHPPRFL